MSLKIEDYALLGDGQAAALVGRDGSIDWLCWPRFDSASCFARILGDEQNGRWLLAPVDTQAKTRRAYRDKTLILETHYETDEGAAVVIDVMPMTRPTCDLVRIVQGLRGTMRFHTELILRPNYGIALPWMKRAKDGSLRAVVGPDAYILRSDVKLEADGKRHCADFSISAGESVDFVMSYHLPFQDPPEPLQSAKALAHTEDKWATWTKTYDDVGPYSDMVLRSLITLRALIYEPSGGIVAAPTTSLPEEIGGSRNWDYRFCWLRDATFTLLALMNGGYVNEAKRWRLWLLRSIGGDPSQIQIMYGIGGEQRIPEIEIERPRGIREFQARAHRQRRLRAIADRHLWRIAGLALPGAQAWPDHGRRRLDGADRAPETSRDHLVREGRGHLGGARRPPAFRLFEGHGLGRLRPGDQDDRGIRPGRPYRQMEEAACGRSMPTSARRAGATRSAPSRRATGPTSSTLRSC